VERKRRGGGRAFISYEGEGRKEEGGTRNRKKVFCAKKGKKKTNFTWKLQTEGRKEGGRGSERGGRDASRVRKKGERRGRNFAVFTQKGKKKKNPEEKKICPAGEKKKEAGGGGHPEPGGKGKADSVPGGGGKKGWVGKKNFSESQEGKGRCQWGRKKKGGGSKKKKSKTFRKKKKGLSERGEKRGGNVKKKTKKKAYPRGGRREGKWKTIQIGRGRGEGTTVYFPEREGGGIALGERNRSGGKRGGRERLLFWRGKSAKSL